jgi:hypothetical protein
MFPCFFMLVSQAIKFPDKALEESLTLLMSPSRGLSAYAFFKWYISRYFVYIIRCVCIVFLY